ncbi:hypothetical protein O1611_g3906 [Lasiodiplodia mahajangana]|uniref:Uncharacterized protein n=1 Tax=Lasiodiplodia mahajangana TaxID=1108764 RepID=A0ACC2JQD5_9PEZI|nr:hypothetical protein O1611_g3906 [Lasiodiplodia mahajangana]
MASIAQHRLDPRNNLTEDFRTATMKRNPDLEQSLPSSMKEEIENRDEYVALTGQIENLALQIKAATNKKTVSQLAQGRTS